MIVSGPYKGHPTEINGFDEYGDALPGYYIHRELIERFREIKPYEAPQYLVEPVDEWRSPEVFGGWEGANLIEVRLLSDNVMGWGDANAIVLFYDHATGERGYYLAVVHNPQVIDHINGDWTDNSIENLEVLSHSEHKKRHELGRRMV